MTWTFAAIAFLPPISFQWSICDVFIPSHIRFASFPLASRSFFASFSQFAACQASPNGPPRSCSYSLSGARQTHRLVHLALRRNADRELGGRPNWRSCRWLCAARPPRKADQNSRFRPRPPSSRWVCLVCRTSPQSRSAWDRSASWCQAFHRQLLLCISLGMPCIVRYDAIDDMGPLLPGFLPASERAIVDKRLSRQYADQTCQLWRAVI